MTPDKPKCEHRDKEGDMDLGWTDAGEVSCLACGQRFVPSDVLEEAKKALEMALSHLQGLNWANRGNNPAVRVREALARIDEALGK